MTRIYHTCKVEDCNLTKQQILNWASQFDICCFVDNQQYESNYSLYEAVAGIGCRVAFKPSENFFSSLDEFLRANNDWIFSHFNYEMRDVIHARSTMPRNHSFAFPDCFLFVPEIVIFLKQDEITIGATHDDFDAILSAIQSKPIQEDYCQPVQFQPILTKQEYLQTIAELKKHIMHGDCYEINFCQQFWAVSPIEPIIVYNQLTHISPNPFSAFYRVNDNYLLCASPERYLKKVDGKVISQPIKGTAARDRDNLEKDRNNKIALQNSPKDRSENVMIVDLVRNDLSRVCEEGSVHVEELFGIYSYPHVHQMISTVTGKLTEGLQFSEILKATFPMGSMTGAPKERVMELIEKYERSNRGIYSGTVGYFTPGKDFDFNVVIRSLVYNSSNQKLSFHVGSAITANSDAKDEYDECLLKGQAIINVFSAKQKVE